MPGSVVFSMQSFLPGSRLLISRSNPCGVWTVTVARTGDALLVIPGAGELLERAGNERSRSSPARETPSPVRDQDRRQGALLLVCADAVGQERRCRGRTSTLSKTGPACAFCSVAQALNARATSASLGSRILSRVYAGGRSRAGAAARCWHPALASTAATVRAMNDRAAHWPCSFLRLAGVPACGVKRERRRRCERTIRHRADGDPERVAGFQAGPAPWHEAGVSNAREQAHARCSPNVRGVLRPSLRAQARTDPALGGEKCKHQPPTHLDVPTPILEVKDPRDQVGAARGFLHELAELKGHPARLGEQPGRLDVDDRAADERGWVHTRPNVFGDHSVTRHDRGQPAQEPLAGS